MANPAIGYIDCALCGSASEVRQYSKGTRKRYWFCDCCGMITPNLMGGQQYIAKNARMIEAAPAANDAAHDAPAEPANDQQPRKRRGIFGGIDL